MDKGGNGGGKNDTHMSHRRLTEKCDLQRPLDLRVAPKAFPEDLKYMFDNARRVLMEALVSRLAKNTRIYADIRTFKASAMPGMCCSMNAALYEEDDVRGERMRSMVRVRMSSRVLVSHTSRQSKGTYPAEPVHLPSPPPTCFSSACSAV